MKNFSTVFLVFLFLVGTGCKHSQNDGDTPVRPNIVFIFSDDHAIQAIGAYGSVINKTPQIDRLAEQGMIFRNAFCTNSICAPSRAVIQTGKHSHINGVLDNRQRFDSLQTTFPKILSAAGYETAMIGKWHLKSEPVGFNYWKVLPGQGYYYNPDFRTPDGLQRIEGYVTNIVADLSIDWLKNGRDKSKPFMLMCQHKAPHREWTPGPDHLNMYDGETIQEPDNLFDDYSGRASGAKLQEMEIGRHMRMDVDLKVKPDSIEKSEFERWTRIFGRMNDQQYAAFEEAYADENAAFKASAMEGAELLRWKYQRYIKDYLRCIASVDDNIGRLLAYLDESGLAANTVVMYSSDQGFYLGEHGWFDKRWMYEESLHMPLIVRWPGVIQPGSVNIDLVQNLDFAETFLEIAGLEVPVEMQGSSLVPIMKGTTPGDWRKSIYYHYYEYPGVHMVQKHNGIRTERYKLIHYYELGEWELFDLDNDPGEMVNLYSDVSYFPVITQLKEELKRLQVYYRDETAPLWD